MMSASAELRGRVQTLDAGRCAYCSTPEELSIATFELDHIVPVSAGGLTEESNLCLACPACNHYKAARLYGEDPVKSCLFSTLETNDGPSILNGRPRRLSWSASHRPAGLLLTSCV